MNLIDNNIRCHELYTLFKESIDFNNTTPAQIAIVDALNKHTTLTIEEKIKLLQSTFYIALAKSTLSDEEKNKQIEIIHTVIPLVNGFMINDYEIRRDLDKAYGTHFSVKK